MTQQDDITQRVLTDDEIMRSAISACDSLNITRFHEIGAPSKTIMDDAGLLELGRAIESALLSKLRAPVADERDALMRAIVKAGQDAGIIRADLETVSGPECLHILECLSRASAPVAGEAQKPVAWFIDWPDEPELGHYIAESPAVSGRNRPLVFGDAASQTSKPVYAYRRKGLDDFVTCDRQRFDELSAKPRLFETRIFYAVPQASEADIIEDVAKQWDGCIYDAGPGGDIDIGKAIRNAASKHKGQAGQQRAVGDERTAFEATYQADYDDPGAACEREHFGKGYRAGLSAQSADKPAISSPSSAGNPCPEPVPAYPETGNSHTDGGAVYG